MHGPTCNNKSVDSTQTLSHPISPLFAFCLRLSALYCRRICVVSRFLEPLQVINMSFQTLGADGLPPGVELFVPPPIDFNPLEEEDEVLLKHGFPRRPPSSSVEELVQWKNLCSSAGLYVTPSFEAAEKEGSQPKSETKTNWSGARIDASKDYKFFKVDGSWTVSRPHPPNKAWESDKVWSSGRFKAGSWVGIGGHAGSHVVQAGVAHRCTSLHYLISPRHRVRNPRLVRVDS